MSVKSKQIHFKKWVTTKIVASHIRAQIDDTQYAERRHEMRLFPYFNFIFDLHNNNLRWHRRNGCSLQNYIRKWDHSPTHATKHRHYEYHSIAMIRVFQNQNCWITFPTLRKKELILFHFQYECVRYESWMSALLWKRWINLFCCIKRDAANDM